MIRFLSGLILFIGLSQISFAVGTYSTREQGFIENKGQITDQNYLPNPEVKYLLCKPGLNVQLRQTGFSYDTYTDSVYQASNIKDTLLMFHGKPMPKQFIQRYHRVDIELQGCAPDAELIPEGKSDAYYNYFTAGTPAGGVSNVHDYRQVTYKNIYPDIDLVFFMQANPTGNKGGVVVEYNFIVHPGGNVADIKLVYKGANSVKLERGQLVLNVAAGNFTENIPASYIRDTHQPVSVSYSALGNNVFAFSLPVSPKKLQGDLVIDPIPNLAWGTYYGGSVAVYAGFSGAAIAVDRNDNVYVTGYTQSSTGIATTGAYQTALAGYTDAFVAKFNASGTSLVWGSYYGGNGGADPHTLGESIAIDSVGNVYITGQTGSRTGIATSGAYQTVLAAGVEAFVAKFNAGGASLAWGTYYGGSGGTTQITSGQGIAIDAAGNVYITGYTENNTGIATNGAYQTAIAGTEDAFVAKFNAGGASLAWGTYYGGSDGTNPVTVGLGIAIDVGGNVYITGSTDNNTGIATNGAYQTTLAGIKDAFVAKFNAGGASLVWGTYYGGNGPNSTTDGSGIAMDAGGNVYIAGSTKSTSGIATSGAYQTALIGAEDAFVAKLNAGGASLAWGTYYGGTGGTYPATSGIGIAIDTGSNVYVIGITESGTGIATSGAYQTALAGYQDAFVAKFNAGGASLAWGTYYGGNGGTNAYTNGSAIAMDAGGNVYIAGWSKSTSGIATSGAYQTVFAGDVDVFVAKFGSNPITIPQGGITANGPFCGSGTGQLNFTAVSGTGPFKVVYFDGTKNDTAINVASGVPFNVAINPVTSTTTYTLVSLTGANGLTTDTGFTRDSATITINALPAVNTVNNQTVCANSSTNAVNFAGSTVPGTAYNWTCSDTSIGLAASGTGSIAPFTARNTGSTLVTATITATPVSPPGGFAYVTVFASDTVDVINVNTNVISARVPVGSGPGGVVVSPDESRVYVVNQNSANISVVNTANNTVVNTIHAFIGSRPFFAAVSPDGNRLYVVGGRNDSVFVVNTLTNTLVAATPVGTNPSCIAVSPDGSKVYVGNAYDNSISVMSAATNTIIATISVPNEPYGIAVSPDGSRLYAALTDAHAVSNIVSVINCATDLVIANIPVARYPQRIAVTPDGSKLYVTHLETDSVSVISTISNTVINAVIVGIDPEGIAITSDGKEVYVANSLDYSVSVINTTTNAVTNTIGVGNIDEEVAISSKGSGCSGVPISFTITVNPTPVAAITGPATGCGSDYLTATGGNTYLWSGGTTPNNAANTFTAGGTYTVTVSNNSCSATASQAITVNQAAVASIVPRGVTTFCPGDSVLLLASAANTYLWSNNATTQNIIAKQSGVYYVEVTAAGGCSATSSSISVTVNPTAVLQLSQTICPGQFYNFNNQNLNASGVYKDTLQTAQGCDSIISLNLTVVPAFISNTTGYLCSQGSSYTFNGVSYASPGVYADTLLGVASHGCDSIAILNLQIANDFNGVIKITSLPKAICSGDSVQLCASPGYRFYRWSTSDTDLCFYTSTPGVYSIVATDTFGCTVTNEVDLAADVPPVPVIESENDSLICNTGQRYQWFLDNAALRNDTVKYIIVTQPGSYTVQVTDSNGCVSVSNPFVILGLNEVYGNSNIKAYPNPTVDGKWQVEVSPELVGSFCAIYDASGRVVYHGNLESTKSVVVADILSGVYFMRINSVNGIYNIKLVQF